eukprot:12631482-Alexandrium_andersonii.AAC.1
MPIPASLVAKAFLCPIVSGSVSGDQAGWPPITAFAHDSCPLPLRRPPLVSAWVFGDLRPLCFGGGVYMMFACAVQGVPGSSIASAGVRR